MIYREFSKTREQGHRGRAGPERNAILKGMAAGEPFRFQTRIRFIDTDTSGRIHYTAMFRYFESAEIEFMRTFGLTYTQRDYAFPRVHVECDFKLALRHDDLIDIDLHLAKIGRSSIRLEFNTYKEEQLAARGVVVIACMDRTTESPRPIPPELREKFAAYLPEDAESTGSDARRGEV
jgi:YbgC/YbaW family acyl-CoA thioester hydrolase